MSNFTLVETRSATLTGGPSDCAIARSFDFQLQTGSTPGCCPGIDSSDVECQSSRVVKVAASEQNTRGPIPSKIGDLTELVYLYAYGNRMPGELPKGIGNLKNLTHLWLYENQLSGFLPDTLVNLKKLESLHLENNKLSGPVSLLPNVKECVIVSGLNDGNKFTCLLGDPTKHIGPCYDNLRVAGVTQLCSPSATVNTAGATDTPQPASSSARASTALPTAAIVGAVCVVLVAITLLGVTLYRRQRATLAGKQPQSLEMGSTLGSSPPLLAGDGPRPTTLHTAVPAQTAEQDHFQDLWSSPTPTEFPPPLPVLTADDGKQVQQILANIERERTASPLYR